jgi:hypothetical protein
LMIKTDSISFRKIDDFLAFSLVLNDVKWQIEKSLTMCLQILRPGRGKGSSFQDPAFSQS